MTLCDLVLSCLTLVATPKLHQKMSFEKLCTGQLLRHCPLGCCDSFLTGLLASREAVARWSLDDCLHIPKQWYCGIFEISHCNHKGVARRRVDPKRDVAGSSAPFFDSIDPFSKLTRLIAHTVKLISIFLTDHRLLVVLGPNRFLEVARRQICPFSLHWDVSACLERVDPETTMASRDEEAAWPSVPPSLLW